MKQPGGLPGHVPKTGTLIELGGMHLMCELEISLTILEQSPGISNIYF